MRAAPPRQFLKGAGQKGPAVSPRQYGYKSVKHVNAISVHIGAPRRYGGVIEHPRARVALEERHALISGRLLRGVYRALIIPTALMAQRSAKGRS